jgi:hypothetical protein
MKIKNIIFIILSLFALTVFASVPEEEMDALEFIAESSLNARTKVDAIMSIIKNSSSEEVALRGIEELSDLSSSISASFTTYLLEKTVELIDSGSIKISNRLLKLYTEYENSPLVGIQNVAKRNLLLLRNN